METCEAVFPQPRRQTRRLPLGMLQAVAGVAVIADEMGELSLGAHGVDRRLVPEHRAVGAVVTHQHPRRLPLAHRLGESGACVLIAVSALKDAQIGAEK